MRARKIINVTLKHRVNWQLEWPYPWRSFDLFGSVRDRIWRCNLATLEQCRSSSPMKIPPRKLVILGKVYSVDSMCSVRIFKDGIKQYDVQVGNYSVVFRWSPGVSEEIWYSRSSTCTFPQIFLPSPTTLTLPSATAPLRIHGIATEWRFWTPRSTSRPLERPKTIGGITRWLFTYPAQTIRVR